MMARQGIEGYLTSYGQQLIADCEQPGHMLIYTTCPPYLKQKKFKKVRDKGDGRQLFEPCVLRSLSTQSSGSEARFSPATSVLIPQSLLLCYAPGAGHLKKNGRKHGKRGAGEEGGFCAESMPQEPEENTCGQRAEA